ncbi:MAG: cytidine deaminase [Lacipirellulaceae bacterium]
MSPITDDQRDALVAAALAARKNAYAPFSHFHVGSAVLGDDGVVYGGANVENSSYGLTICAERSACVTAVSAGARAIHAVAVVTDGAAAPCGACRQFLYELGSDSLSVLLVEASTGAVERMVTLGELLPDGFRLG